MAHPSAATRRAPCRHSSAVTKVTIQYSKLGNYFKVARRLADAIREEFKGAPIETELEPVLGSAYEVSVDGKLVFSKRATYRLPAADEIFYHVRAALNGGGMGVPPGQSRS